MNARVARWFLFALCFVPLLVSADDWYRWRGPDLNGISKETGWFKPWPKEGPKQIWKANVGPGYATVSISKGRVFTTGSANKTETITCLDEKTGKTIWTHTYPTAFVPQFYEGGSSGTPTVDGDRVFHLGQMGEFFCFEAASGKVIWSNNIAKATGTQIPTWGLTAAPLVLGDRLIVHAGAAGSAVEKATGKVIWHSEGEGGYSTPVPFGDHLLIFGTRALACVAEKSGKVAWSFPWDNTYHMNAADPIVVNGERVFISSDYNRGCALLEAKGDKVAAIWENKNMKNPFASSVLLNGFVYGIDAYAGKPNGTLRCLDIHTGDLKWSEASIGNGALMAAENKLIVISEKGELVIVEPTPQSFKAVARAQVLGGRCWTVPVLSNGKIFCRNARGDLVCVDPSGN
jgi:outer membrane protein assembly factor BamB